VDSKNAVQMDVDGPAWIQFSNNMVINWLAYMKYEIYDIPEVLIAFTFNESLKQKCNLSIAETFTIMKH